VPASVHGAAMLERFGFLTTAGWLRWRALRNSLTHE
jgi:hypothetical protein